MAVFTLGIAGRIKKTTAVLGTAFVHFYPVPFLNHYPCGLKSTPEALMERAKKRRQSKATGIAKVMNFAL